MRDWKAILADVTAASDGAQMCLNTSFDFEGEVRRRPAIERKLSYAGKLGMANYGAPNGGQYVVLVTDAGALQVEASP